MWSRIGSLWSSSTWLQLVVQRQTSRMEKCRLTNSNLIDWPLRVEDSRSARRRKQKWNKCLLFLSACLLTGLGWLYNHRAGLPRPGLEGAPVCLCRNERLARLQWLLAQDADDYCILSKKSAKCEEAGIERNEFLYVCLRFVGVERLWETCQAKMERKKPSRAARAAFIAVTSLVMCRMSWRTSWWICHSSMCPVCINFGHWLHQILILSSMFFVCFIFVFLLGRSPLLGLVFQFFEVVRSLNWAVDVSSLLIFQCQSWNSSWIHSCRPMQSLIKFETLSDLRATFGIVRVWDVRVWDAQCSKSRFHCSLIFNFEITYTT